MANQTRTYNPKALKMSYLGVPIEDGLNDGDFVSVEQQTPAFESVAGADGTVSRARTNDDRVTITLTLLQNSAANFFLNSQFLLDTESQNGAGVGPFYMKDMITGDTILVAEAWISNRGAVTRGKGTASMEWTIEGASSKMFLAPVL